MKQNKEESYEALNNFFKPLKIKLWKDLLQLPPLNRKLPFASIHLEKEYHFTWCFSQKNTCILLVSPKSELLNIYQLLPFFRQPLVIYACPSILIDHRLKQMESGEIEWVHNEVSIYLKKLLEKAIQYNASDIHLEKLGNKRRVRMRIDGVLMDRNDIESYPMGLIVKIKLIAKMDIAQTRIPQDGHMDFMGSNGQLFDLRISSIPSIYGEKIVIRLLPVDSQRLSLKELSLSKHILTDIYKAIQQQSGFVLIAGPTGSGKTTTLYGILQELITLPINIMTIEDPVEYRIEEITQVEVNEKAGITFANMLRSFLRQDPDVILVGEIRDEETAHIAIRAAQTGHLVLSTIHSTNVFEVFQRLYGLGVTTEEITSSLTLVLSQRLIPKTCSCKGKKDCILCEGRGVLGRVPIAESLLITETIKETLFKKVPLHELRQAAVKNGFIPLKEMNQQIV